MGASGVGDEAAGEEGASESAVPDDGDVTDFGDAQAQTKVARSTPMAVAERLGMAFPCR